MGFTVPIIQPAPIEKDRQNLVFSMALMVFFFLYLDCAYRSERRRLAAKSGLLRDKFFNQIKRDRRMKEPSFGGLFFTSTTSSIGQSRARQMRSITNTFSTGASSVALSAAPSVRTCQTVGRMRLTQERTSHKSNLPATCVVHSKGRSCHSSLALHM